MEASATVSTTGSKTIADLIPQRGARTASAPLCATSATAHGTT